MQLGDAVSKEIHELIDHDWTLPQIGDVCIMLRNARSSSSLMASMDLVLSGPDIDGIPTRDTEAVMHALLAEATEEVLLIGYVIHNAQPLLRPLAERMAKNADLNVRFCIDVSRDRNDTSSPDDIKRRFIEEFKTLHWPWEPRPSVYFDPRSLEPWGSKRSSLHAKCLVIDRTTALVTSANFTEAAQQRNIEAGVVVRDVQFANRIAEYFVSLCEQGHLSQLLPEGG